MLYLQTRMYPINGILNDISMQVLQVDIKLWVLKSRQEPDGLHAG